MVEETSALAKAIAAQNALAVSELATEEGGTAIRVLVTGVYNDLSNKRIPGVVEQGARIVVQAGYAETFIADGLAELFVAIEMPTETTVVTMSEKVSEELANEDAVPPAQPKRRSVKA